ncbi:MAG: metal ABC transporter solute-binding protein, Zn/Mn family [Desulfococcaceae bacterium]
MKRADLLPLQKSVFAIQVFLLLLAGFSIFGDAAHAEYDGDYPYSAAATVGMVADIVGEVAGDKAEVVRIVDAGVDPHNFTPTRGDVATFLRADVIFYSGLMLEGQMIDVLEKVGRRLPVFAVTERLDPKYLLQDAETGDPDPHVWMDVSGWIRAVDVVEKGLGEFDPKNADGYAERAAEYRERLAKLDEYAKRAIGSIPENQRVMITAHDAFRYLGRAYNLEVIGIQGLSTESEAGLKDINNIVDQLVERNIPAVFVETSVSDKNVRALVEGAKARGHSVKIGGELFSDAMGPAGTYEGTYIGMIDHNVTTIAQALGGDAPEGGMQGKLGGER